MEAVLQKLDEIKGDLEQGVTDKIKSVNENVDSVKAELNEKVVNLEAKIASMPGAPSVVREFAKNIAQDRGRAVLEQLRMFAQDKIPGSKKGAYEVKLWESADQFEEYKYEKAVALAEASQLTGSGSGKGGMIRYQNFFRTRRFDNNLRQLGSVYATDGSDFQWRVRIGDSGLQWGYIINQNNANNTEDTAIWQISLKTVNSVFPIRSTFLMDTNSGGYESVLMEDLVNEASAFEGQSAVQNNDQTGSGTTVRTGGTDGLRGLNQYGGANTTFTGGTYTLGSFGTSGSASTNGLHNVGTYDQLTSNGNTVGTNNLKYQDIVNLTMALPLPYWNAANVFWMSPYEVPAARGLTDNQGRPIWIDGLREGDGFSAQTGNGYLGTMLGHAVYANSYVDTPWSTTGTAGTINKYPIWFGDFSEAHNTIDSLSLILRRYDQTLPGSITYYMEKRSATTIRQPAAITRLRSTATAGA